MNPRNRPALGILRDALRAQLWPLPVVGVVLSVVLGVGVTRLDAGIGSSLSDWWSRLLFGGDADAARTVLSAVAGSLITVTSLTFSLTVVTLQLASSQFSPRLLRTFSRDLSVQASLAVLLGTFVFSLTVLREVRSAQTGGSEFVPRIAVTISYLLAVASVITLVLFLAHLSLPIRVETMLREVDGDTLDTLDAELEEGGQAPAALPEVPSSARPILALSSGFLLGVDRDRLLEAAVEHDAVVVVDACPGDQVVAGVPIGWVWPAAGGVRVDDRRHNDDHHDVCGAVTDSLRVGYERTAAQDIGYGLRQLTDVTNKALSPGINDPTTAVHALGHIASLLCALSRRDLGPILLRDDDGVMRAAANQRRFGRLMDEAIEQPRRYGAADVQVASRLFRLLAEVAWVSPSHVHHDVRDQLRRLRASVAAQDFDQDELALLERQGDRVVAALDGTWLPAG